MTYFRIKLATFESVVLELQNPGLDEKLWQTAINFECDHSYKPDSHDTNLHDVYVPLNMIRKLHRTNRLSFDFVEKMLNVKFTEKHLKSDEAETYLLGNAFPYDSFPELGNYTWIKRHMMEADKAILIEKDAVQHKECVRQEDGSFAIGLVIRIVLTEEREIWNCEDIGATPNVNTYEFYYIRPHWMTTDINNETWFINEDECYYNLSVCNEHEYHEVTCSVNNIEKCGKVVMSRSSIENNWSSHVRSLAGGVAVYGTFQVRRFLDLESYMLIPGNERVLRRPRSDTDKAEVGTLLLQFLRMTRREH